MRYLRSLIFGVAVALATGCSAVAPVVAPLTAPATSATAIDPICDQPIVATLNRTSEKGIITAIRRVTDGRASRITVLDSPATARIDWDVPPPVWVHNPQVEQAIQTSVESPITGQAGTLAEVDRNLQSITETKTHIGYAAVVPVSIDILVTCSNVPRILGTVRTWKLTEIGAVTCAQNPPSGDRAELARRAQQLYCTS